MDSALEIVTLSRSTTPPSLLLNRENLQKIIQAAGNRKLSIISVAGPFGTGKSFLLSIIIRYLEHLERGPDAVSNDSSWLLPQDQARLKGFRFESSVDLVTPGIQMWSRPFISSDENALLLMDTRGIFEEGTTLREWAGIVGTTLALSSCTIFNVSRNIQEDSLQALDTFLQYAKLISGSQDNEEEMSKFCQHITFLIRDWNNPDEFGYGMEDGNKFIHSKLSQQDGITEEARQVRASINNSIEKCDCCLLPHPGENITFIEYNKPIEADCLDERFAGYLSDFVSNLLLEENVQPKRLHGESLTGSELLDTMKTFIHTFNSTFTTEVSTLDAALQLQNEMAILGGVKFYESTMERKLKKKNSFKTVHVHDIHSKLKPYLLEQFMKRKNYDPTSSEGYRSKLDELLEIQFQKFLKMNEQLSKEHFEKVKTECLHEVNDIIERLSILERIVGFEIIWEQISTDAVSAFKAHIKKVDETLREIYLESFMQALATIYDTVSKRNKEIHAEFLENHEDDLLDAAEQYETQMSLALGGFQTHDVNFYLKPDRLEAQHEKFKEAAIVFLRRRFKMPNAQVLLSILEEKLLGRIQVLFEKFKTANDKAGDCVQNAVAEQRKELANDFVIKVEHIFDLDITPEEAIQTVKQLYQQEYRDAEVKALTISLGIPDKAMAATFKDQVLQDMKATYEQALGSFQSLIDSQKKSREQLLSSSVSSFKESIQNFKEELLEPEHCVKQLKSSKEEAIRLFRSKAEEIQALDGNLIDEFTKQIDGIIADVLHTNNSRYEQVQRTVQDLLTSAVANYNTSVKRKLDHTSTATRDEIKLAQESVKSEILANFSKDALKYLQLHQLESHLHKLSQQIQALQQEQLLQHEQECERVLEDAIGQYEAKAKKLFTQEIEEYTSQFDLISEDDYEAATNNIRKKMTPKVETELLDFSDSVEVLEKVKQKLATLAKRCWQEDISSKNEDTENEIRQQITEMKRFYANKLTQASSITLQERNGFIRKYFNKYRFSDDGDRINYKQSFERALIQVEDELVAKSTASSRKIYEAKQSINNKFNQLASEKDEDGLTELYQECITEFTQVTDDQNGVADFSKELSITLEKFKKNLKSESEGQSRKIQTIVEELKRESRRSVQSANSKENYKKTYLEKLEQVTKQPGIKIASMGAYIQELDEALESNWENKVKRNAPRPAAVLSPAELQELTLRVTKHYRDSMSDDFKTPKYMLADQLSEIHSTAARDAINSIATHRLDHESEGKLYKALEKVFQEFDAKNKMNTPTSVAIGIDLGTTYSCVGVYINGKVQIIPNDQGKKTTPSYVYIDSNGDKLVGEAAKAQSHMHPERTIYEVKRLIGRKIDDPAIQNDIAKWPFRVVNELGVPKIHVDDKTYHPEEISSKILIKMKEIAEAYLKQPVAAAVITVPAYFNDGQRAATKAAGEAAGLEVLRIINEPTAAAIAYNLNWTGEKSSSRGLVYDLGGGTFDVAIYEAKEGSIDIIGVGGDTHLGGVDFDNEMVNYCVTEFKKQTGHDLVANQNSMNLDESTGVNRRLMRLKTRCEEYKILLSGSSHITVDIPAIYNRKDMTVRVEKTQFEKMIEKHVTNSLECVTSVLKETKLTKRDVDEVVLIGGSTRIPKVREMLQKYFGKSLSTGVNPDEAVAIGAAFEAAVLNGAKAHAKGDVRAASIAPKGMSIKDVTPMSYGLEMEDGGMMVMIPKQTQVPVEMSKTFLTAYNNQTSVQIVIYEGDQPKAKDNTLVGEFYLNGIPPGLAGRNKIKVTMKVNHEGIITVSATCEENGRTKELTVRANKKRMTGQQIEEVKRSKK